MARVGNRVLNRILKDRFPTSKFDCWPDPEGWSELDFDVDVCDWDAPYWERDHRKLRA